MHNIAEMSEGQICTAIELLTSPEWNDTVGNIIQGKIEAYTNVVIMSDKDDERNRGIILGLSSILELPFALKDHLEQLRNKNT